MLIYNNVQQLRGEEGLNAIILYQAPFLVWRAAFGVYLNSWVDIKALLVNNTS